MKDPDKNISHEDQAMLQQFKIGAISYMTYQALIEIPPDTTAEALCIALRRATDPEDSLFSEHAALHDDSKAAAEKLATDLDRRQASMENFTEVMRSGQRRNRVIVTGAPETYTFSRPAPFLAALNIMKELVELQIHDPKDRSRLYTDRLLELEKTYHIGFAILTALYLNCSPFDCIQYFSTRNEKVNKLNYEKRKFYPTIPSRDNQMEFTDLYGKLKSLLLKNGMVTDNGMNYATAVELLSEQNYLSNELEDRPLRISEELCTPVAVFRGTGEVEPHTEDALYKGTTHLVTVFFRNTYMPLNPFFDDIGYSATYDL